MYIYSINPLRSTCSLATLDQIRIPVFNQELYRVYPLYNSHQQNVQQNKC